VRVLVVPGSQEVKRQAMAEGLPEIFRAPGGRKVEFPIAAYEARRVESIDTRA